MLSLLALLTVPDAAAKPRFFGVLTTTYDSPAVAARTCENCHGPVGPPALNPYGLALQAGFGPEREVTTAALLQVEALDSDGDGRPNGEELRGGSAPGTVDGGAVPPPAASVAPPKESAKPEVPEIVPRHGEHPLFVHFPIALFISGLALDFLGVVRKNRGLLYAGWCNLVLAALGTLASMASGAAALWLSNIPFQGLIRTHAMLAMFGALTLFLLVGMRVHRHDRLSPAQRVLYYLLAMTGLGLIGTAAHLGGSYVYGE